jgi:hypothetical protein
MEKEDNEWLIRVRDHVSTGQAIEADINNTEYKYLTSDAGSITHAVLLLVDAVNDVSQEIRRLRLKMGEND